MIKPSDVKPRGSKTNTHDHEVVQIRMACDHAIQNSDRTQNWPALVRHPEISISQAAIQQVISEYMDAGWVAECTRDGCIMSIDRPVSG